MTEFRPVSQAVEDYLKAIYRLEQREGKVTTKALALYQDTPNRGERCAGCTHFEKPNGSEIVAGAISPNGWCRFHEPLPA